MDPATAGVLRDAAILVAVALVLGAIAYGRLRRARPTLAWNWSGRVDARSYNMFDAVVVAAVCLMVVGGIQGGKEIAAKAEAPQLTVTALVLGIALNLMICAILLGYLQGIRRLHPAELFGLRRSGLGRVLGMAVLFMLPVWLVVGVFAQMVSNWMKGFWPSEMAQEMVEAFRDSDSMPAKMMVVVAAAVIAPLVEEIVFRGFVYGVIKRYSDGYFAAICSSLLFGVVHFHVGSFFPLVVLALAFCLVYELTGNLLVPMVMHGIFNGANLVMLAVYKEAV